MATEIELKARVEAPQALGDRLSALAGGGAAFEKADTYWLVPPGGVRLRRETTGSPAGEVSAAWVSYKVKELREGLEVNDEREFTVSDPDAFEALMGRLALERGGEKHKQGWVWVYRGITAELCLVRGLGWFVELEIIADNDRRETVDAARERLLALLAEIGVSPERIEVRPYLELLSLS